MIRLEIRPKTGPFGRWWHRPIVWLQRLIAPPSFVMVLADGNVGHVYSSVPLTMSTILHEAQHVWQSMDDGVWMFRLNYLLSVTWGKV